MKELFVPFDIALRAKELGFNEPCFTYYCTDGYFSETPKNSGDDIKYPGDSKFDEHTNDLLNEDYEEIDDESEDIREVCSETLYQQLIDWLKIKHYFIIRLGLSGDNYEIIRYGNYEKLHEGVDNIDIAIRETFKLIDNS